MTAKPLLDSSSQTDIAGQSRSVTVAGIALLVVLGAFLRLFQLGTQTISHLEMFVPGIRLPPGLSVPTECLTVVQVLKRTFFQDTGPPAYYLLMLPWTKCFGTTTWALRLPSALFGVASIPLVFWLGTLTRQRTAGWIAATLLAVNGHQVFWSQVARMYSQACFLGLLATILLLLIAEDRDASPSLKFLYVLTLLAGVCTHIFFWTVLAAHIVWTFLNAWNSRQTFPGVGTLQLLAVILGCPILAIAAYQGGVTLAILSDNVLIYAREFLQFAFMFPLEGFSSGVYRRASHTALVSNPHLSYGRWAFFFLSLLLLFLGITSIRKSEEKSLLDTGGVSSRTWAVGGATATLTILLFIFAVQTLVPRPFPNLRTTKLMSVMPLAIAGLAIAFRRSWVRLASWSNLVVDSRFVIGGQGLVLTLLVVPFAGLSLVSLYKPIFNARGMLLFAPYLFLVLARGMERLSRHGIVAALLLIVVGAADYTGWKDYRCMTIGRADYKALAIALAPHIEKEELIFFRSDWYSTPILYYLNADRDRFVGRRYETACLLKPRSRVWALWFYNYEERLPRPIEQVLWNYKATRTIEAPGVRAVLYSPQE